MARFSDLPEELVAEILALLSVDSLMRFKCVQKSWYSLIVNPKFVVKQLHNQIYKRNSSVLLTCKLLTDTGGEEDALSLLSFEKNAGMSSAEDCVSAVGKIIEIPVYKDKLFRYLLGHCHGIICLAFHSGAVILANPAIREFRELPETRIHRWESSDAVNWWPLSVGFGYDLKSNDYKVVRFLRLVCNPSNHASTRAEVYTLSTDSWRELNDVDFFGVGMCFLHSVECLYLKGACYWIAWSDFDETEVFVLSFDMSNEVFRKIPVPVPNSSLLAGEEYQKLMVSNESLAFVYHKAHGIHISSEIWVMDEIGVNGTWKKLVMVESSSRVQWPLAFWENDELIMAGKTGKLYSYNIGTKEIKDLQFPRCLRKLSVVIYTSSLVSIRGGNRLDIG